MSRTAHLVARITRDGRVYDLRTFSEFPVSSHHAAPWHWQVELAQTTEPTYAAAASSLAARWRRLSSRQRHDLLGRACAAARRLPAHGAISFVVGPRDPVGVTAFVGR